MIPRQILESMSTKSLDQKRKFSTFALNAVWIGGAIAINASVIKSAVSGVFPATTFVMAIVALLVSIPVYQERKMILEILGARNN